MEAAIRKALEPGHWHDEQQADLRRWIELNQQHRVLISQIHSGQGVGHDLSRKLDLIWHEKAVLADRLLSAITSRMSG